MKTTIRHQRLRASLIAAAVLLMASVRMAAADSLTLQWDLSTDPSVNGYVMHVGNQPGIFTQTFDVGVTDTFTMSTVAGQQYCFAVTAYAGSVSSAYSNWVCGYSNAYPTLTGTINRTTVVGNSVSVQFVGADPLNDPITYAASGLPPGLSVNATSGLVTGVPTTVGSYAVTVSVSDGTLTTSQMFTWAIVAVTTQITPERDVSSGALTGRTAVRRTNTTTTSSRQYTGAVATRRQTTTTTTQSYSGGPTVRALIDSTGARSSGSGISAVAQLPGQEAAVPTSTVEAPMVAANAPNTTAASKGTVPEIAIETPVEHASFPANAAVMFSAVANDAEDGDLKARVVWTSSRDGRIGTGGTVVKVLRSGTHVITASVTDNDGLTHTAQVTVVVAR